MQFIENTLLFEGIDVLQRYKNKLYFLDDLIKLFYFFLIGIIIIKCIKFYRLLSPIR